VRPTPALASSAPTTRPPSPIRSCASSSPGRATRVPATALVEGRAVGSWKRIVTAKAIESRVLLLTALPDTDRQAVAEEADRFGAFFGLPAAVCVETQTRH
jgi:hypothetical protein